MNEQILIYGIIIPATIFILSFSITYLLYRRFSVELQKRDKESSEK
ncbi:MAG: hypothetical protein AB1410_02220 [Acidobacteriota bacterium]